MEVRSSRLRMLNSGSSESINRPESFTSRTHTTYLSDTQSELCHLWDTAQIAQRSIFKGMTFRSLFGTSQPVKGTD